MAFTTLTDDEFYYGRRQLIDYDRTAQPTYGYQPLTPADFLDPQEEDVFNHGPRHDETVLRLYATLRTHYRVNPLMTVLSGVKLQWGIPDLSQPAPDVVIATGAESWDQQRTVIDVAAEGVTPTLIVEVGDSAVIDASGQVLAALGPEPTTVTLTLSAEQVHAWRERFPAYRDADAFELQS